MTGVMEHIATIFAQRKELRNRKAHSEKLRKENEKANELKL